MKKIILKKVDEQTNRKNIGYKINYEYVLNAAQYEAVMHNEGAALVIAGAGTGKTRTLTYRVARLIEDGVNPESILLLTFTRKAAAEMLRRASILLDGRCEKVSGGTFHSFALLLLRKYSKSIGYEQTFTVLDQSDSEDTINFIRTQQKFAQSKKRFPRKNTLCDMFSLAVNKQSTIEEIVKDSYPAYTEEIEAIIKLHQEYDNYKRQYNLMDYDDLLLNLLQLTKTEILKRINSIYNYVMVDEYQDTNRLQHEIVLRLAGKNENVMSVGDDAQSIYSFRGANFQNIMFFPESFSNCKIYKIEENYRSTQPILDITNHIIKEAVYKYEKKLFTRRTEGELPKILSSKNERQQSAFVVQQILELREEGYDLQDIAVLFRSAFHSFDLEIELNKHNIPYMKFGGMKFIETAHIKDLIAYMRVLFNPRDAISWQRILLLLKGVGPASASKYIALFTSYNLFDKTNEKSISKKLSGNVLELYKMLSDLKNDKTGLGENASIISEYYKPLLKEKYDDWQKRWKDVETFISIAERYNSLREFLNDIIIEPPVESLAELQPESKENEFLSLSTIHSAKGLEWKAVFLIWALEGRFPSAKSVESLDSLEEERRLFYVACTRAKDSLFITYPTNIFDFNSGAILSKQSRFLDGIGEDLADRYNIVEEQDETLSPN